MKTFLKKLFARSGGVERIRAAQKSRFRILMYHRFAGETGVMQGRLTEQLTYLKQRYRLVSLGSVCDSLRTRETFQEGALAITVDDGYRDFATAWPVFRAAGVPVTLYAVSGFLSRQLWLWPDVLDYALKTTRRPLLNLELPDGSLFGGSPRVAFDPIAQALIRSADRERRSFLERVSELTDVPIPAQIPAAYAPLDWRELKEMAEQGLDVGAHTRTHPILSRLATREQKQEEIGGSRGDIEKEIGMPVRHFCYPNGKDADYDSDCVEVAEAAGFASAVTAVRGLNAPGADCFRLRRIGVDPHLAPVTFQLEAAGYRMA